MQKNINSEKNLNIVLFWISLIEFHFIKGIESIFKKYN